MGEFVLFLAGIVALLLWAEGKALYGIVTGETRQKEEHQRSLWEAKSQFKEAVLHGRFPSEAVLSVLGKCQSHIDYKGHYHDHRIPDYLWSEVPYLRCEIDYDEAVKLVRREQRVEAERKANANKHREIAERLTNIISLCSAPWDEMIRTAKALHGDFRSVSFMQAIKYDLLQILNPMSVANGTVPEELGRLYQAVLVLLELKERLTVEDCISMIAQWERKAMKIPAAIDLLYTFDQMKGSRLSQTVGDTYFLFLETVSSSFPDSLAVTIVKNQYASLLTPFVSDNKNNGKYTTGVNRNCLECSEYYPVLRLKPEANEDEVKTAYRDLTQIYHPDRFNGNERLRRTAEDEMKKVNVAYSHIVGHFMEPVR